MDWAGAQVSHIGEMESQVLDLGEMVCARHLIPTGFESAPYYRGLPDDMCPCEHWCYLARGKLRYRFADGETCNVQAGQAFHVRRGHLADALEDAELIEFTAAGAFRRKAAHLESRQVENPATGERVAFLRTAEETGGEFLEIDNIWTRPDHQTPEHAHPGMEERWELISGRACFRIDGSQRLVEPGEAIVAPPGSLHTAWNAGAGPVHLRIRMTPALRWQEFVERLFALGGNGSAGGSEPADVAAINALMAEFEDEIVTAP